MLPGPDTPLPDDAGGATTIHVLVEDDRPTHSVVLCGFTDKPVGQWPKGNKYVYESETEWHKHVNCSRCRLLLQASQDVR